MDDEVKYPGLYGIDYVICQECGKRMKIISTEHLRSTNVCTGRLNTLKEYKVKYPQAVITSESLLQALSICKRKCENPNFDAVFYAEKGTTRTNYPYPPTWTNRFRRFIRDIYHNECVITGMTNEEHKKRYGKLLAVHHWNYDKDERNPFYFVPLRCDVHAKTHADKDYWINRFRKIAEEKFLS